MTGPAGRLAPAAAGLAGLLLLAHVPGPLAAQQEERLAFRHLTVADGLSQNTVQALLQDRRGFLWIGTKDGLNRHDGYTFLVFRHDPSDSASLSAGNVTALLEDGEGRLWVGTRGGGLNRFDRARKRFRRYPDGPDRAITSLAADGAGDLWIGTEGDGLYRLRRRSFDADRPVFDRYVHDPSDPGSLGDDGIHDLLVDRRGELWVGTDAGLDRLGAPAAAADDPRFRRYGAGPAAGGGLIDRRVSALLEDREGRLWVGGTAGLSVLDADRASIAHHPHRYRTRRYGWGEAVDLLEDGDGRIWVSTHSELMRFDPATTAFAYVRHDPLDPDGINSNAPMALWRDRSGVIWVGTNGYGLNVHDPKAGRFRTFRRPRDRSYRNAGFSVYTIFEDSGGHVWIGAGVLYRWDRTTGAVRSFETTSERVEDFGNTGAWSIVEDPPGRLWVGTFEGLYRYEIATGRWRRYVHDPADPAGLPEKQVFGVHRARDGSIWAVTRSHLARLEDPEAGRFRSHRYLDDAPPDRWTFPSLREDAGGRFWLGSNRGLVRFDPATGTVLRRYRADPSAAGGLAHDEVRALLADPDEPERYLWIGTAGGGLQRLDRRTGTFDRWTVEDGLPNDVVYGILADGRGHLWLSTNRGLARFDPASGEVRSYDAGDGLQSDEFNSGAAYRSPSGELFFGGPYGLNYFRPAEIEDNPHVPPVVLTGFHRRNRPETVRDSGTVLTAAISEADTVRISHADDVVAFDFAALDYSAPAKNRYAYRLVGFSDVWVEAGAQRSATYTNLPPGAYTFQVKGSNNDGVWNEEGASLALVVSPPWWGSRWAYALYGLAVLAALYGVRRYEMDRLRLAGRLEMEQLEAAKLRELDRARTRFFGDVSHELRTPLTLVTGPLGDLLGGRHGELSAAVREQLGLARRSAGQVLELINQVLEVARLEAGGTPLRARPMELGAFVEEAAAGFAALAERERLDFAVATPDEPLTVHGDPEQLEKALANLLSNAMKFTPAGGTVRVSVEGDDAAARVAVRDSGPGIPAAELPHVFDRFFRAEGASDRRQPGTGIGLALAREVVELHGGTLRAESEEGFGSTFVLELPRGRGHLSPDQIVTGEGPEPLPDGEVPTASEAARPDDGASSSGAARPGRPGTAAPPATDRADGDRTGGDRATVLVVEDHPEVRAYLRGHLATRYRVIEAADGEEGLEAARARLPDLVLSDVMMPGLDGFGLCRALKADPATAFLPVVLLTARAGAEDRLAGLEEQADDYLTKPFDPAELLARVENLIGSRRRLRERLVGPGPSLHPDPVEVTPTDRAFLDRVGAVLEDRIGDEDFTVERFAREVGYSRGHLHRRLRELLDETPSELVRRMRLERAAQLLEADAGTVGAVAYAVGFKSVAHFSNRFVDHFGVRPSVYADEPTERVASEGAGGRDAAAEEREERAGDGEEDGAGSDG